MKMKNQYKNKIKIIIFMFEIIKLIVNYSKSKKMSSKKQI